jgi:hypothetical protein
MDYGERASEQARNDERRAAARQNSYGSGRSGPVDKKKNARMCIGFIIIVILAVVALVILGVSL